MKMNFAFYLIALTIASQSSLVWGQESSNSKFLLNDFISGVLNKSDSYAQKKLEVEKSQELVKEKKTAYLPTVNATVSATKADSLSLASNNSIVQSNDEVVTNSKLNLTQNIFNGFQDKEQIKSSEQELKANQYNLSETKRAQIEEAMNSFFAILQYKSDIANQQKEMEYNESSLKRSISNAKAGNARRTEVISLQSTIASNQIDLAQNQALLEQEIAKAKRLMNVQEGSIDVAYPTFKFNATDIESILNKLNPSERADLKAQEALTQSQKSQLEAIKANRLPTLDLTASYIATDTQAISQKDSYTLGLTLTIPFPFGEEKKSQIAQAAKTLEISQRQERQKKNELDLEKEQLIVTLKADVEQIKRLAAAKKLSNENVEAIKKDHAVGLSTYSEVLTAFSNYQQILRRYDRSLFQLELDCYRALIWSANESNLKELFSGV